MKYTLVIVGSATGSQAPHSALAFARACLAQGHHIYRVFFYGEGVSLGSPLIVSPQDETDIAAAWRALIDEHRIDAVLCIASALKRGILNTSEAARYERPGSNVADEFDISGLGQLTDALLESDRVLTFG